MTPTRIVTLALLGLFLTTACSTLPQVERIDRQVWLDQNWSEEQRNWFHHVSQGTATIPLPYEWLIALERPGITLISAPKMLLEPAFMARLGFIPGSYNRHNPAGLPVGFAVDYDTTDPVTGLTYNAVGLTCAACHTGQMTYQGTAIRYDGGPAMTNLSELTNILFLSMLETRYSGPRFERFAKRVLGERYTLANTKALKKRFSRVLKGLIESQLAAIKASDNEVIEADLDSGRESDTLRDVADNTKKQLEDVEGFTRLDALNRIGNMVFSADMQRPENFVRPNAPVNYPHIWSTSWFDWVQYDGSVMQPMVRNAGEALGVRALVDLIPGSDRQYASSVPVKQLYEIEQLLAGEQHPMDKRQFDGLRAPKWPEDILGEIDQKLAAQGAELYRDNCQSCHMPATNTAAFWEDKHWAARDLNGDRLLKMNIIKQGYIGTDPAQADVLKQRTVNTEGLKLGTRIYSNTNWNNYGPKANPNDCQPKVIEAGKDTLFAFALGAVVQNTTDHWYQTHSTPGTQRLQFDGARLNCLQAGAGYKARPLNGIWATAPFLHNGSVPTLFDLLSPVAERPSVFFLGHLEFDPRDVGYQHDRADGMSELDVSQPGNSNAGHEFADGPRGNGVIGRALSVDERYALIEYLKTL